MIRIAFEDTATSEKHEAWFTVESAHTFSEAVEYMIDLLAGWEHRTPGMKFTKATVDPVMRDMQYQYLVECHVKAIVSHKSKEAAKVRAALWKKYTTRLRQEDQPDEKGYGDRSNFERALRRVSLPKVRISESLPPGVLEELRQKNEW